ncbi:sulfotransferase [Sphingomonas sp.]|uniref:sulfotransferase n=1 Tax=Sphingomonas sp. TaxID=28214 RepID=UPI0031D5AB37
MKSDQAKEALQGGRLVEAEALARHGLAATPDDRDLLYVMAVAQRYQDKADDALVTLDRLVAAHPDYARAEQERGHVLVALDRPAEAREAFDRAVAGNPALHASWRALVALNADNPREAERAREEVAYLTAMPRELLSVASMIYEGRLQPAEEVCRRYLRAHPTDVEAMRLLADIGTRLHVYDDAEFLLESALEFEPGYALARLDYVGVLHKRQKFAAAHAQAARLHAMDRDNPLFQNALANESAAIGRYDEALAIYDALVASGAAAAGTHLARGHALKTIGRQEEAVAAYRAAYGTQPDFGDAYWSLANLKTYRFTDDEMRAMAAAAQAPGTSIDDRAHLHFALGKAHEDRRDHAAAFAHYDAGNRLRREQSRYDADAMDREMDAQIRFFTPELIARMAGTGEPSDAPIFIVGLPRAGSTLVEQILASHSRVEGTLELPNIMALAHRLNGRRRADEGELYPDCLGELGGEDFARFGREFLDETQVHRTGRPHFTDKMPNNFRHIGLIHLILPNARIIDARRDPMDCCFSGFKQLFAEGQEFTYGLEEVGRYYRGYVRLMAHWDAVLPGKVLRVQYEDMIDDLERQVRRILDHCGLAFEQSCLDFHKTRRSVRTASSEQVRQPIYRSGMAQWRPFEPWLDPLKRALGADIHPDR